MLLCSREVRHPPQVIQYDSIQVGFRDMVSRAGILASLAVGGAAEVVLFQLHLTRAAQHHVPATVGAVDQSGEQSRRIHVLGRTAFVFPNALYRVPRLLVNDGLMGVLHQHLFLRRTVEYLLVLVGQGTALHIQRVTKVHRIG